MPVYLIHFREKYKHAAHYIGYSHNKLTLKCRINHHRQGNGSRLLSVLNEHNISYAVVRVWINGDRKLERQLKDKKHSSRLCPICNPGYEHIPDQEFSSAELAELNIDQDCKEILQIDCATDL